MMKKIKVTLKNPNDVDLVLCRKIGDEILWKYTKNGLYWLYNICSG